jgi:uncharacterized membrane protein YdfJ with MMPL/SSD domain
MLAPIVVLLLVLFRSPGLPFLVIGAIFGVGEGVISLLNIAGHFFGFQLDQTTTLLLSAVLFGVGTDYAVFLLYRYRDRLRAGDDHRAAMAARHRQGRSRHGGQRAGRRGAGDAGHLGNVAARGSGHRFEEARPQQQVDRHRRGRATSAAAGLVARRPVPVALAAAAVLAALAVCAVGYHAS